jgi:hypothetical protein
MSCSPVRRRVMRRMLALLAPLMFAAAGPAPEDRLNDPATPEGWLWQQVQAGETADFNERCGSDKIDPRTAEDAHWHAECRAVNPRFLRMLLTQPGLADRAPHGVQISGMRIVGKLNLDDAHITAAGIVLQDSRLEGDFSLSNARLDGMLSLENSVVTGTMDASTLRAGDLALSKVEFAGPLLLIGTDIRGVIGIDHTKFLPGQKFTATGLQVGSDLVLQDVEFGGEVNLAIANVRGELAITGTTFADRQNLIATNLQVGGLLVMQNVRFGGDVNLDGANVHDRIAFLATKFAPDRQLEATVLQAGKDLMFNDVEFGGDVNLTNADVHGDFGMDGVKLAAGKQFTANSVQVGGGIFVSNAEFGGDLSLVGANVHRQFNMDGVKFAPDRQLDADGLHADSDMFMRNGQFGREIVLVSAGVGRNLDLRGSTLHRVDLSGAAIGGDLRLGGAGVQATWVANHGDASLMALRNARIGNLQDDERAWPTQLVLEGFTYAHLGGFGGEGAQDMRGREVKWWRRWLARDPVYSPQPYTQLASVLAAGGNQDAAASVRFFGRDRERAGALNGCVWLQRLGVVAVPSRAASCSWGTWIGLSALQLFVGYGIGGYTFRALYWAIALTLLGTIILCFAPGVRGRLYFKGTGGRGPRQKPMLWCFGASLSHLLPIVSLNPEFNDFFNDPARQRLYAWQQVVFAVLALCGWALGLFVVAAFSGLTQN